MCHNSLLLSFHLSFGIDGDQWDIESFYFFENTYHPSNESGCYLLGIVFFDV